MDRITEPWMPGAATQQIENHYDCFGFLLTPGFFLSNALCLATQIRLWMQEDLGDAQPAVIFLGFGFLLTFTGTANGTTMIIHLMNDRSNRARGCYGNEIARQSPVGQSTKVPVMVGYTLVPIAALILHCIVVQEQAWIFVALANLLLGMFMAGLVWMAPTD